MSSAAADTHGDLSSLGGQRRVELFVQEASQLDNAVERLQVRTRL
jgi:hypothetical protein